MGPVFVWNGIDGVAVQVAWNQRHTSKNILHWTDVERRHLSGSPFVQHGHALPLHAAVWSQADRFKGAEENK